MYTVTDLGTGFEGSGLKLSDTGVVAGQDTTGAILIQNGKRTTIGSSRFTGATAINAANQVGGWRTNFTPTGFTQYVFTWSNGVLKEWPHDGAPVGILASDQVVLNVLGTSGTASNHVIVLTNGVPHAFADGYQAQAVNSAGQMAGERYTLTGFDAAYFYNGSTNIDLPMPSGVKSFAIGINDSGDITGIIQSSASVSSAFIYKQGTVTTLPAVPGSVSMYGRAINNSDQVVGAAAMPTSTVNSTANAAFVYQNGVTALLDSRIPASDGWTLTDATSINARGQIVAQGMHNGVEGACLLTPVQ